VSGPLLRGPVLDLLVNERKIPESAAIDLKEVADRLNRSEDVDATLVERLKQGASSKH
jgi:hypothetical protein